MIQIIDRRSSGKTNKLLLLAKEKEARVVCHDPYDLKEKSYTIWYIWIKFYVLLGF